jgi:hypothetical protein
LLGFRAEITEEDLKKDDWKSQWQSFVNVPTEENSKAMWIAYSTNYETACQVLESWISYTWITKQYVIGADLRSKLGTEL